MTTARTLAIVLTLLGSVILTGGTPHALTATEDVDQFDRQGLTTREVVTLWSGDDDTAGSPGVAIYDAFPDTPAYESNLSLATQTDIIYQTPPEHAQTWTENAFDDLGSRQFSDDSSLHPDSANVVDEGLIQDAHATVYAVTPSTILHNGEGRQRYIGPNGGVMALVDYRVQDRSGYTDPDPPGENITRREVDWTLTTSQIQAERLYADDTRVGKKSNGLNLDGRPSNTPRFTYSADDDVDELRVEADIKVTYQRSVTTTRRVKTEVQNPLDNDTEYAIYSDTERDRITDTVTVTDTVDVDVYRLTEGFEGWTASFPDGPARYGVKMEKPWAGYRVEAGSNGLLSNRQTSNRVHTRWQFYTARERGWRDLQTTNETGTEDRDLLAPPVAIHAYPAASDSTNFADTVARTLQVSSVEDGQIQIENTSTQPIQIDASTEPGSGDSAGAVQLDPQLMESWGPTRDGVRLSENLRVNEADSEYTATRGVTAQHPTMSAGKSVRLYGILPGVDTRVSSSRLEARTVREANLSLSVADYQDGQTTLRVSVHDAETGNLVPIRYPGADRYDQLRDNSEGLLPREVGRVEIKHSVSGETWTVRPQNGTTTLSVPYEGGFSAHYEPASWVLADPAYRPAWASARSGTLGDVLNIGPRHAATLTFLAACWLAWRMSGSIVRIGRKLIDES